MIDLINELPETPEEMLAAVIGHGRDPADPEQLAEMTRDYQHTYGLLEDGVLGRVTTRHLEQPRFCMVPDFVRQASSPICRWDESIWRGPLAGWKIGDDPAKGWDGQTPRELQLTWFIADTQLPNNRDEITTAIQGALDLYPGICALRFRRTNNAADANVLCQWGAIDGPGQVLAWSELSCGPDRQLKQMYDSQDRWFYGATRTQQGLAHFRLTVWHEFGHGNGLDHGGNGAMAPFANNALWLPQAGYDIDQHVLRYGPPVTASPPPVGSEKQITLDLDGAIWKGVVTKQAA